ncbi:MAG: GNAT family N-acetyltransferase [Mycoplasmatota bacterium]
MIELYIPKTKDMWYKKKIQEDPLTMSYNSGWDVSYDGYNYNDGTINLPLESYIKNYENNNNFFAYIIDTEKNQFIGYCNYFINEKTNIGILIEAQHRNKGYSKKALMLLIKQAKKDGIKEIYDTFENNREKTNIFYDLGFFKNKEINATRFKKEITLIEVKKIINE